MSTATKTAMSNIPSPDDRLAPSTCDHLLELMEECMHEAREHGMDYGDPYEKTWNKICTLMLTISGRPPRMYDDENETDELENYDEH